MLSTLGLIFAVSAWPALQAFQIPDSCELNTLYQEMNCTPIFEEGSKCPVEYDCEKFMKLNTTMCHFAGKAYAKGEDLKDKDSPDACLKCTCGDAYPDKGNADWACTIPQCTGNEDLPDAGCVNIYTTLNSCCSAKFYCEKMDPKPNNTCSYKGKTYVEGQMMYDHEKCKQCICDANFNETLEGPSCRYQSCCHTLPPSITYLREGCVPVYYEKSHCSCPINHKCPESTDAIAKSSKKLGSVPKTTEPTDAVTKSTKNSNSMPESRRKCSFGYLTLKVGDKLVQKEEESFECSCETPPYITCIQKSQEDKQMRILKSGRK